MSKKLSDAIYDQEIERISHLAGFPHLPKAQLQLRRALRRITDVDAQFLHRLISEVVDGSNACPKPQELAKRAEELRRQRKPAGRADCSQCHGSGYVTIVRQVAIAGMAPYEAEFAAVCTCRGGK
jgi:hypothetical protein